MNRNSSVSVVSRLWVGRDEVSIRAEKRDIATCETSEPSLGHYRLRVNLIMGLFLEVKQPGREAYHSLPSMPDATTLRHRNIDKDNFYLP